MGFPANAWALVKDTVTGFIDDNALSRGASIAYYTLFSIAPVLLIIVAIAGLVFGRDAAQGAIVGQLSGLMGEQTAKALEEMIKSADNRAAGIVATIVGIVALIVTATGVFGEVQSAINAIWKVKPKSSTLSRLVRARLASLGLVITCGFLLTVSLAVSAGLQALSKYLKGIFPGADAALQVFDFVASTAIISGLFAAIYTVLPDKPITWRSARWPRLSCSKAASI
ncbi:MAG: rane protein [Bradyrhizobium sp.]|jgi:membrane protein|nr:rane protein [Bradyrhizobium sp.]